jgi:hypothetical protein
VAAPTPSKPEDEDTEPLGHKAELVWPTLGFTRAVPWGDQDELRMLAMAARSRKALPQRWLNRMARHLESLADAPPESRAQVFGRRLRRGPKPGLAFDVALLYAVLRERGHPSTRAAMEVSEAHGGRVACDSVLSSKLLGQAREVVRYVLERRTSEPDHEVREGKLTITRRWTRPQALAAMEKDLREAARPRCAQEPSKLSGESVR